MKAPLKRLTSLPRDMIYNLVESLCTVLVYSLIFFQISDRDVFTAVKLVPSSSNGFDSVGSCTMAVENASCGHFILYVFNFLGKLFLYKLQC